jgi:toxin FitB
MYLLDTNVISEVRKHKRADQNVINWFETTDSDLMFISPIVTAELELGSLLVERRDPIQGALLRKWVNGVFHEFRQRCVPIDMDTGRIYASLHAPDKRPERDAWIAASALRHGLKIVTRNTADFDRMNLGTINPWAFAG